MAEHRSHQEVAVNEESWAVKLAVFFAIMFVLLSLGGLAGGLLACYRGDPECAGPFASHK